MCAYSASKYMYVVCVHVRVCACVCVCVYACATFNHIFASNTDGKCTTGETSSRKHRVKCGDIAAAWRNGYAILGLC